MAAFATACATSEHADTVSSFSECDYHAVATDPPDDVPDPTLLEGTWHPGPSDEIPGLETFIGPFTIEVTGPVQPWEERIADADNPSRCAPATPVKRSTVPVRITAGGQAFDYDASIGTQEDPGEPLIFGFSGRVMELDQALTELATDWYADDLDGQVGYLHSVDQWVSWDGTFEPAGPVGEWSVGMDFGVDPDGPSTRAHTFFGPAIPPDHDATE